MALTKIIEVIGESNKSWEDAAKNAIAVGITGLHIKNLTATVNEKGEIVEYKANVNLAYVDK